MANIGRRAFGGQRILLVSASVLALGLGMGAQARAATLTTIDYFTTDNQSAAILAMLKTCSDATGIQTDRQKVPYPELVQKVLQAASSNSLPDLILMDNSDAAQLASGGIIVPMADVGETLDGFDPTLVAVGNYQGKDYTMQPGVNTLGLWYNVDMFKAAGIDKPPTTWDELKADAKKLTTKDVYGLAFPAVATEEGTFHASPFIWSNGGDFQTINSQNNIDTLNYLKGLIDDGSVSKSVVTWTGNGANDQFMAGRAAMVIGGSWHLAANEKGNIHYEITSIPTPKGEQVKVPVGGEAWGVSATADKAAAKTFLDCLAQDPNVLSWSIGGSYVPAKKAVLEDFKKAKANMIPFISSTAGATSRTSVLGVDYPKYSSAFSAAEQAVLTGAKDAKTALDEAEKQATGK
jgi:multiple sugar transport system substrate-binding protein